jgi:hypothetical protein
MIVVEQLHPRAPEHRYPFCVDGWGQCPPEDCGGVLGYENLVRVMQDRYDPEYAELRRWLGRKFDPDEFSVERVNRKLAARGRSELCGRDADAIHGRMISSST